MRNTFIETLIKKAEFDESIILIVGDLGYNVIEPFQSKFPDRFINAGICEQNMASMAAGLASEGYKVFIYSIANFPTFRCAEQIRNDICYHNLDVTIVVVGGGLAYGNLGYSHHAIQDYGLMRLFPEMSIISPGDPNETKELFNFIIEDCSPKYLRLRKAGEKIYTKPNLRLNPGFWSPVFINNPKKIFLSTGYGMHLAFEEINNNPLYKDYSLYSCPIWGSKYNSIQLEQAKFFDTIITIEDHLPSCGFGSWLNECLNESLNNFRLSSISLKDTVIGQVGKEDYLLDNLGE